MRCAARCCGHAERRRLGLRILYLHQHFTLRAGAAPARSHAQARALVQAGHEVTVLCGRYQGAATGLTGAFRRGRRDGVVEGIRVVELDLPYGNALGALARARMFARYALAALAEAVLGRHDVVFASSTPLSVALPGIAARWLRGRAFVLELRDLWPELPIAMGVLRNPLVILALRALERLAYASASGVVAVTQGIATHVAERGVDAARIVVVPNGADLDARAVNAPVTWTERGAVHPVLLYAGTIGRANGLEAAVDLAEALQQQGSPWRIVVVGEGGRKAALQAEAAARGLTTIAFRPALPRAELAELVAGAALGFQCLADVTAFREGTSPNKLFEYLAAGLPVLVNTPGWVARLVEAEGAGIVVPPGDPQAAARALDALADPTARAAMGLRARALAERFDRTLLSRDAVRAVEAAAERHAPRPTPVVA